MRNKQLAEAAALSRIRNEVSPYSMVWLIFFLGGLFFSGWFWREIKGSHFMDASSYATTNGVIFDGYIYKRSSRYEKRRKRFFYVFQYQYSVNGVRYESNQVEFKRGDNRATPDYLQKYPINGRVIVYYDKHDPSFSVLEPAATDNFADLLIATGVMGVLCAWCCLLECAKENELLEKSMRQYERTAKRPRRKRHGSRKSRRAHLNRSTHRRE